MMKQGIYRTLLTEAGECGKHKNGWERYPRPQMKREGYMLLGEGWTLDDKPIHVPFVPQSDLSGFQGVVGKKLTYKVTFKIPDSFVKERILLHFGGVDQIAEVWINDHFIGRHADGYTAFSFDVTNQVKRDGENVLEVRVTDALSKKYPYGKQRKRCGGMWYTPISGIWQNVWLENVPSNYVEHISLKPDLEGVHITLERIGCVEATVCGFRAIVTLHNGETLEQTFESYEEYLKLTDHVCADGSVYQPRLWTPEDPFLYSMKIVTDMDEVETYFALRTIDIRNVEGVNRVCLNGEPIFLHGVLDQGYFSDGIYLPAEPEEYERDILRMKELGMNMLRKHIKVEPEAFYYYCDKHGMLVMQDMVNSGGYSFLRDTALPTLGMKRMKDTRKIGKERKAIFKKHVEQVISQLYSHPCIVAYTIFNEGWGQFDSDEMYDFVKKLDDSRLVDATSGWFWQKKSDFDSEHIYFKTRELTVGERPLLVSECGGYTRKIAEHSFNLKRSYGYGSASDEKELTDRIAGMYREMILPGIPKGVCGCVYTQLSDVEDEVNGLYTYDRKVCKVDKERMRKLAEELKI